MGDYLNNLINKTLGRDNVVQPRLASLFEPPGLSIEPDTEIQEQHTTTSSPVKNTPKPYAPLINIEKKESDKTPPHPQSDNPLPHPQLFSDKRIIRDQPIDGRDSKIAITAAPEPVETANEQLSVRSIPTRPQYELSQNPQPKSKNGLGVFLTGEDLSSTESKTPEKDHIIEPVSIEVKRILPPEGLEPGSQKPQKATKTETGVATQYHVMPNIEPEKPTAGGPVATSTKPPSVRVTIGRVDVRAVMPSAAQAPLPKTTNTSPVQSLDDYLKQRNGEAR